MLPKFHTDNWIAIVTPEIIKVNGTANPLKIPRAQSCSSSDSDSDSDSNKRKSRKDTSKLQNGDHEKNGHKSEGEISETNKSPKSSRSRKNTKRSSSSSSSDSSSTSEEGKEKKKKKKRSTSKKSSKKRSRSSSDERYYTKVPYKREGYPGNWYSTRGNYPQNRYLTYDKFYWRPYYSGGGRQNHRDAMTYGRRRRSRSRERRSRSRSRSPRRRKPQTTSHRSRSRSASRRSRSDSNSRDSRTRRQRSRSRSGDSRRRRSGSRGKSHSSTRSGPRNNSPGKADKRRCPPAHPGTSYRGRHYSGGGSYTSHTYKPARDRHCSYEEGGSFAEIFGGVVNSRRLPKHRYGDHSAPAPLMPYSDLSQDGNNNDLLDGAVPVSEDDDEEEEGEITEFDKFILRLGSSTNTERKVVRRPSPITAPGQSPFRPLSALSAVSAEGSLLSISDRFTPDLDRIDQNPDRVVESRPVEDAMVESLNSKIRERVASRCSSPSESVKNGAAKAVELIMKTPKGRIPGLDLSKSCGSDHSIGGGPLDYVDESPVSGASPALPVKSCETTTTTAASSDDVCLSESESQATPIRDENDDTEDDKFLDTVMGSLPRSQSSQSELDTTLVNDPEVVVLESAVEVSVQDDSESIDAENSEEPEGSETDAETKVEDPNKSVEPCDRPGTTSDNGMESDSDDSLEKGDPEKDLSKMVESAEERNKTGSGYMLSGLSSEQVRRIRDKKMQIEKAYKQDTETFTCCVQMLISDYSFRKGLVLWSTQEQPHERSCETSLTELSLIFGCSSMFMFTYFKHCKDPNLEGAIMTSLRENLREMGALCVHELEEYISTIRLEQVAKP